MRLVFAFLVLFAVPAQASTIQFKVEATGWTDFVNDDNHLGVAPFQEIETGIWHASLTLFEPGVWYAQFGPYPEILGFGPTDASSGVVHVSPTNGSEQYSFNFNTGIATLNREFEGGEANFRVMEMAITPVPLPASGLLLLGGLALMRLRYNRQRRNS